MEDALFDPKKFRPKTAVEILSSDRLEPTLEPTAKIIALSELIAWTCLDQEKRTKRKPSSPTAKYVIRTEAAMRARQLAIAMLLHRQMKRRDANKEIIMQLLLSILSRAGGIKVLIEEGYSIKYLLKKFRKKDVTLKYVVEIVRYLVRCHSHPSDSNRSTLEDAKTFVRLSHVELGLRKLGSSKINKIWEDFNPAAPYIFALYEEPGFRPIDAKNADVVLDWLGAFVQRHQRVARLLGRSAAAMDVLNLASRRQRTSDFVKVQRMTIAVRPFTEREREIISKIDHKSPIKARHYRPKHKPIKRVHTSTV
jgi:hypothetical protein